MAKSTRRRLDESDEPSEGKRSTEECFQVDRSYKRVSLLSSSSSSRDLIFLTHIRLSLSLSYSCSCFLLYTFPSYHFACQCCYAITKSNHIYLYIVSIYGFHQIFSEVSASTDCGSCCVNSCHVDLIHGVPKVKRIETVNPSVSSKKDGKSYKHQC